MRPGGSSSIGGQEGAMGKEKMDDDRVSSGPAVMRGSKAGVGRGRGRGGAAKGGVGKNLGGGAAKGGGKGGGGEKGAHKKTANSSKTGYILICDYTCVDLDLLDCACICVYLCESLYICRHMYMYIYK